MPSVARKRDTPQIIPILAQESVYIGVDVGKHTHVAGFVSHTLMERHTQFEACPVLKFENSREGFRQLVDRIRSYVPLEQCFVLLEKTGHYHKALEQYLLELDIAVYVIHVQERPKGMVKTDKRDALGLANHLYNQLEKGIQVVDKLQLIRRAVATSPSAALLRALMRHRYELIQETTRRKNKLTAIYDEVFPEFTQIFKDPNLPSALAFRQQFPTPQAVATARLDTLCKVRVGRYPATAKLVELQTLAAQSIGTKDIARQRGLVLEQAQLIKELQLMQDHIAELDREIMATVAQSREGQILTSIPPVGPIQAATLIAAIGNIDNFPSAAALKAYFGWAPTTVQTGSTLDQVTLGRGGTRTTKQTMFLIVGNAIQMDCEWKRIYDRLVPIKCSYDERTRRYKGKVKVMGRIAGQMITLMFALLKHDQEVLRSIPADQIPPEPMCYDPAVHKAHRAGQYRPLKPKPRSGKVIQLVQRQTSAPGSIP
jgi:transposase